MYNKCMFIEVSHESPTSILEHSMSYNDYAYALVHLFENNTKYYNFYKNLTDTRSHAVLLDNSIFELGKSFEPKEYTKWIDKLDPNYYIVPDVLEDAASTIDKWKRWSRDHECDTDALKIGVVQGKTWNDLVRCYNFMKDNADIIAISFDYSYYLSTGLVDSDTVEPKLQKFCSGRKRFIHQLIDEGYWCWDKPHHLLGCSLAKEFRFYVDNNIHNIKSVDTSNPVVAAIHDTRYNDDQGLYYKPTTMLADLIDHEFTDKQLGLLEYNTKMFKKIIRR